jgi:ABC-type uncharacterized transport system substrate-binding protein
LIALAFCAPASLAAAHPHIWIKATATLQFEGGKITGILHEWEFDEFFSSALISDFDKNKNKAFDAAEIKELEANAFAALKEYGYFTHPRTNGKAETIATVRDFAPVIKGNRVIYRFVAVLPQPVDPKSDRFDAGVYDESYYVELEMSPQQGVKLAGGGSEACQWTIAEDKSAPLYFGITFARRIEIRCNGK